MGHIWVTKLYHLAKGLFEWMYLAEDCATVVAKCVGCQAEKGKLKALPLMPTDKGERPFLVWAIDYITNLPLTVEGYRYLLLMVDVFSKWVELIPMQTKESAEVAAAVRTHVIARFGCPRVLRCDRGTEFAGALTSLCQELGI